MTVEELDPRRRKLLEAKLGDHLAWTRPTLVAAVGPSDETVFETYDAVRKEAIASAIQWLEERTDQEIATLSGELRVANDRIEIEWPDDVLKKIRVLGSHALPWFACGLGHPDHVADFEHWAKMPSYALHEVLCLSVGVEPGSFSASFVEDLSDSDEQRLWPSMRFLRKRRELLVRWAASQINGKRPTPRHFLAWAESVELEVHPEFVRLIRLYHSSKPSISADRTPPPEPDRREVDTVAQLFTAMAIEQFGYDPSQDRSPIPREIAELAASLGLSISNDTVRKYLKRGASFLPKDWKPE